MNYPKSHKGNHVHPDDSDMLSVEEAQKEILSNIKVLEEKEIPLIDSTDYVLAENIIADTDPNFSHPYMWNIGPQFQKRAFQLWNLE